MCRQFAFAVTAFVVSHHMVAALITRCVEFGEDRLSFQCPKHHVIYDIVLRLGHENNSRCDDCAEDDMRLQREITKCFWMRFCLVKWNTSQTLTSLEGEQCTYMGHNSVIYDIPTCVQKGCIFNICDRRDNIAKTMRGVLRSHGGYPASYEILIGRQCRKLMKPKSGHDLKLVVDDVYLDDHDELIIFHHEQQHTTVLARGSTISNKTFTVTNGYLEIIFQVSNKTKGTRKGFIVRFENIRSRTIYSKEAELIVLSSGKTALLRKGKRSKSSAVAAVGEMIPRNGGTITFACASGQVITTLEVLAGAGVRNQSAYIRGDCLGQYYSLLAQTMRCYWKNSCHIEKTANLLLSITNSLKCLGASPNYITTRRHQCFQKDSIFNICDRTFVIINATKGVIKSHQHYPWYYTTKFTICRKRIRVNRKYGLRIYTDEMDLDPTERGDNIKIFWLKDHKKYMKKIVGVQRFEAHFRSGVVDLQFRVSRRNRGGHGFLIKFETIVQPPGQIFERDVDDYRKHSRSALGISSVKRLPRKEQNQRIPLVRGSGSVRCSRKLCRRHGHWSMQRHRSSGRRARERRLYTDRKTRRMKYFLPAYDRN